MKKTTLVWLLKKPSRLCGVFFQKLVARDKLRWVPDRMYLKLRYRHMVGKKLDLRNPTTLNEKLQWLKLNNRNPDDCQLVDKYEVRAYIEEKLGAEYLIPLLGVWDRPEDIDFENLPQQFVLKCTHDSGSVILCKDKSAFNINQAIDKLNKKIKHNLFWEGREWPYKNLKPKVIAEAYMENDDGSDLIDYKFFCFNGRPEMVYVSQGLSDHSTAHISYVSMDWKQEPFRRSDFAVFETIPDKPMNFEKMVNFSKKLSARHPFVRIDFYEISGKLYFSEITFYPGSGYTEFTPDEWNYYWGQRLELPGHVAEDKSRK